MASSASESDVGLTNMISPVPVSGAQTDTCPALFDGTLLFYGICQGLKASHDKNRPNLFLPFEHSTGLPSVGSMEKDEQESLRK